MTETEHVTTVSAAWMRRPDVLAVVQALGAPDVDVRFVGGCIRDTIIGRAVSDIDLATPDLPETVIEKAAAAGLKVVPTGLSHGTVTVVSEGTGFEVTTLRRDTATDGRHADVAFTTDWEEDASRRDFTFNAMSVRPDGTLFDYFGGQDDARAGRVRFIGEAKDRIQEDYLRILRYFRFLALYGKEPPLKETLDACTDLRTGLDALSIERVRDEIVKLLNANDPSAAIEAMDRTKIWSQVFPEGTEREVLRALIEVERHAVVEKSDGLWLCRFVALLPPSRQTGEQASTRLKLSNKETKAVLYAHDAAGDAPRLFDGGSKAYFLYSYEPKTLQAAVLIAWARSLTKDPGVNSSKWDTVYRETLEWVPKVFPLKGKDVKAFGLNEGPEIGGLLKQLEQEWVENDFKMSADDLRQRLKDLVS